MSGTRDNTRNDRATALLKKLFEERIDVSIVIESAKNPSNEALSSSHNDSALPPIELKFIPFIAPPVLTSENKQIIVALMQQAKDAVSKKQLNLATTLLGPTILKTTNESNHLIDMQRKAAVKHQIELALTNTILTVIKNHFIKKQKMLLTLTYQTSNGSALVKLLDNKKTTVTKEEMVAQKDKRNGIISTEEQKTILHEFYKSLPPDEVMDIVARVNKQIPQFIDLSLNEGELEEKVCFVLREKWLSVEYLSHITKEQLLANAKSALEDTKADILAALIHMIGMTLKSEKHDIDDAAIQNIRNESVTYIDKLIKSTLNEVRNTIIADGNKTAKGALLDLHEKAKKLKNTCALDTKKAKELMDTYEKKSTQLKKEYLEDKSISAILKSLSLTPKDVIDAQIGEIDLAEFDREQTQASLQTNSPLAIENNNDADALLAAFLDDKEPVASTPMMTSAHLAQNVTQTIVEKLSTNTDCSGYFKLIDRLIIAGQVNVDLKTILDEAPDLSLELVDKLITNVYIVLITLFTQKLSTARLHPLTTNNEKDTLTKTIDQIKAYKEAHATAPHFGSYHLKKMHLQLQLENIARIVEIATPQLNAQLSLPAAAAPATPLPTARDIYWKAASSLFSSLWAASPTERQDARNQPMQRITSSQNPNTPLLTSSITYR